MSMEKVCITVPRKVLDELEKKAKQYNVTLNELLVMAIMNAIDSL